jgi:phytoene dehydrogenase-like protein
MGKTIIIVGAGWAGLSTGCYAQMNGYKTSIFEMYSIPSGLCTAWKRKGYKFDISMHLLTGSVLGPLNKMWRELGVINNFDFHYHNHFSRVESKEKNISFCNDKENLEDQMLAISPDDTILIKEFTTLIFGRDMLDAASLKPAALQNFTDKLKVFSLILPLIKTFIKYKNKSLQEFAERFTDHFLRKAVRYFIDAHGWSMPDYPMITMTGFVKSGMF